MTSNLFGSIAQVAGQEQSRAVQELEQLKSQEDALQVMKTFGDFRNQEAALFDEASRNLSGSGDGFSKAYTQGFAERSRKLFEGQDMNPERRNMLARQVEQFRVDTEEAARKVEVNKRAAFIKGQFAEELDKRSNEILNSPDAFEESIVDFEIIGGAFPGDVNDPSTVKGDMFRQWKEKLGMAHLLGRRTNIQSDAINGKLSIEDAMNLEKGLYDELSSNKWNDFLDQEELIKLKNKFLGEQQSFQNKIISANSQRLNSMLPDNYASLETTGVALEGIDEMVTQVANATGNKFLLEQHQRRTEQAKAVFGINSAASDNNWNLALSRLQELKPEAGSVGFKEKQANYVQALKAYKSARKDFIEDPMAAVADNGAVLGAEGFENQVRAAVSEQIRGGISPSSVKVLTNDNVKQIAKLINESPADGIEQVLTEIRDQYDFKIGNKKAYDIALKQIGDTTKSPLDSGKALLMNHVGEFYFNDLANAVTLGKSEIKTRLKAQDSRYDKEESIRVFTRETGKKFEPLVASVTSTGINDLTFLNNLQENTENYAMYLVATNRAKNQKDAVGMAYDHLVGDHLNFVKNHTDSSKRFIVPNEISGTRIDPGFVQFALRKSETSRMIDKKIESLGLGIQGINLGTQIADENLAKKSLQETGFWATTPDGEGVRYYANFGNAGVQPLRFADGSELRLSYLDIMSNDDGLAAYNASASASLELLKSPLLPFKAVGAGLSVAGKGLSKIFEPTMEVYGVGLEMLEDFKNSSDGEIRGGSTGASRL